VQAVRALFVVLTLAGTSLSAQAGSDFKLDITLARDTLSSKDGPTIIAANVLRDARTVQLLQAGFPTRLHYHMGLWRKDGLLNSLEREAEWDVRVEYAPASRLYRVYLKVGTVETELGQDSTLTAAEALVDRPYAIVLGPMHKGAQYYYDVSATIRSLTGGDVDETVRWLQGAEPTVQGKRNFFTGALTALKDGAETAFSRMLGRKDSYERTSTLFVAG
jgi:hypothetical protein